jgi:CheY-like chemotaxis protein
LAPIRIRATSSSAISSPGNALAIAASNSAGNSADCHIARISRDAAARSLLFNARETASRPCTLNRCLLDDGFAAPTIFVSGLAHETTRREALAAGAVGFLSKPFGQKSLIDCLKTALMRQHADIFHHWVAKADMAWSTLFNKRGVTNRNAPCDIRWDRSTTSPPNCGASIATAIRIGSIT